MKFIATLLLVVLVIAGIHYYSLHEAATDAAVQNAKTVIVTTTASDADAATSAALKGIAPVSLAYYAKDRNYGVSSSVNICTDSTSSASVGAIIGGIQKYTKAISCAVAPTFPATSFTITAPSFVNKGEYYCTDQNGAVDLISGLSGNGFKAGLSCE